MTLLIGFVARRWWLLLRGVFVVLALRLRCLGRRQRAA